MIYEITEKPISKLIIFTAIIKKTYHDRESTNNVLSSSRLQSESEFNGDGIMKDYPRGTRAKFQNAHAVNRCGQKTGILFTKKMRKEFVNRIQTNKNVTFLERQSNRVTLWRISYENNQFDVVYDKNTKTIVTVLQVHDG